MADHKIEPDEQLIQHKAYELWQLRGCPAGNPEHDWFEALRLLTTEEAAVASPQTDVASVRADARALATQAQQASSREPPAATQPAAASKRPSAPAEPREKLQNGFKALAKETRQGSSRKAGKG
jgi:uncharacterized membrane protein